MKQEPELPFITIDNITALRETFQRNLNPKRSTPSIKGPDGKMYATYNQVKNKFRGLPAKLGVYLSACIGPKITMEQCDMANIMGFGAALDESLMAITEGSTYWSKISHTPVVIEAIVHYGISVFVGINYIHTDTKEKSVSSFSFFRERFTDINPNTAQDMPQFDYAIPVGNYIAMDGNGVWAQHKKKPSKCAGVSVWDGSYYDPGTAEIKTKPYSSWEDSLHKMTENGLVHVSD